MNDFKIREYVVLVLSVFLAMVLSIIPLPDSVPPELGYLRPNWVALVMFWWVIACPHKIGLLTAWIVGLMMDVLLDSLFGQHALALIVIVFIALGFHQRLRMFNIGQMILVVFVMLLLNQLINDGIESITGTVHWSLWNFMSVLSGALLWPLVFLILHSLRRWDSVS